MRSTTAAMAVLFLAACGGETTAADAGAHDAGPGDAGAGRDAAIADGGGVDASPAADAGMDAGIDAGIDAGTPDGGGVDASAARITLSEVAIYANCMLPSPPDPINAFWRVNITDAPGTSVTLTSATLLIEGPSGSTIQSLTVDAPVVSLSGGAGSAAQRKTGADVNPTGGCTTLCAAGTTFELTLSYDVAGTSIVVTETGAFECAY